MATLAKRTNSAIRKLDKWARQGFITPGTDGAQPVEGAVFFSATMGAAVWFPGESTKGNTSGMAPPAEMLNNEDSRTKEFWTVEQLDSLARFAAVERGRYALNNVLLEWMPKGIRATATDGRRLASVLRGLENLRECHSFHVNAQALPFLMDLLKKHAGRGYHRGVEFALVMRDGAPLGVALYNSAGAAALVFAGDGQFPDYRSVLPRTDHTLGLHNDFWVAMAAAEHMVGVESQAVRIDAKHEDGKARMMLSAKNGPFTANAEIGAPDWRDNSKPLTIGLDPRYLCDVSGLCLALYPKEQQIELRYTDGDTGVYFSAKAEDTILVMPIDI